MMLRKYLKTKCALSYAFVQIVILTIYNDWFKIKIIIVQQQSLMRLQSYGRLIQEPLVTEQSQSSRVLIKSSDIEVTQHILKSLDKVDREKEKEKLRNKQNTNFDKDKYKNKKTIETQRNRILTSQSQDASLFRNGISVQSYSFNRKGESRGETYCSLEDQQNQQLNLVEVNGSYLDYSKMQYRLRIQSLSRQYQMKIKKQKQLHRLELWKLNQEIRELKGVIQIQKMRSLETQDIKPYCHLCSNGEVISGLTRMKKELQEVHEQCLKNQNQTGIKMLNQQQELSKAKQRIQEITKQNIYSIQKVGNLQKLNLNLAQQLRSTQIKFSNLQKQLIKQKQDKQEKISKQRINRQKLQRISYNDISIPQPSNISLVYNQSTTGSKSISNICGVANQQRRDTISYLSSMKKRNQVDPVVQRVKSLSQFQYRPSCERREPQKRYY